MAGGEATAVVRLVVDRDASGQRLDRFLVAGAAAASRGRAQTLLRHGRVRVGGVPRKASYALRAGEVVEVHPAAAPAMPGPQPEPEALSLDIVYEDASLLAINKPAGLVVHPAPGHWRGTLVNALVHHLGGVVAAGDPARPGIVHRLDRDTSGVLVVAKTAAAHEALAAQFRRRTVTKRYVAVVRGRMPAPEGIIDRPIARHPRERRRMSVHAARGRPSATRYVVVEDHGLASVVRLFPTTGRTHQLRVHLAAVGHPIVGDPLYGGRRFRARAADDPLIEALRRFPRQALHAELLELDHPVRGTRLRFSAGPPDDLRALLAALRAARSTVGRANVRAKS
jgi:23S rRNA pseudouridine1911/1915/1917 synthase